MLALYDKTKNHIPVRLFNDWVEVMQWTNLNIHSDNEHQYCVGELYWFDVIYYKWKYGLKAPEKRRFKKK